MKTTITRLDPADFIGPAPDEPASSETASDQSADATPEQAPELVTDQATDAEASEQTADEQPADGATSRVRYVGPRVKLEIEIDQDSFEPEVDKAFRDLAKQVRIKGFRPGKAPRKVLERQLGANAGRVAALEDAIPRYYADAVREHGLEVTNQPEIEVTSGVDEGAITFDATVEVRPVLAIDQYKGLEVEVPNPEPTQDDITERIDSLRQQGAHLEPVDRPAEHGDQITIDLSGEVDGTPLPGLLAQGYTYEIGSGGIVPSFDDEVTGASAGDERRFAAPHPTQADVTIDFTVNVATVSVAVLPELTDDWVADNSDSDTVDDLRSQLTERLRLERKYQATLAMRAGLERKLAEQVEGPVPDAMTSTVVSNRLTEVARQAQSAGLQIEEWVQRTQPSAEHFFGQLVNEADIGVRLSLAVAAVANAEQFDITDEEVAEVRGANDVSSADSADGAPSDAEIRGWLANRKAFELVLDTAVLTDPDGNPVDRDALEIAPPETGQATADSSAVDFDFVVRESAADSSEDASPEPDNDQPDSPPADNQETNPS